MGSILRKTPHARRKIAAATGAVLTNAGQIKIDLNKDFLVAEHILNIAVSQTWGTNAPTSCDVRRFFTKAEVVTSDGVLFSCDFHQLYDLARFTEAASAPVFTAGAGGGAAATVTFSVDLHHINDECLYDLWTALRTADLSSASVVLTIAADASNGFIGGTGTAGAAGYTVTVDQRAIPGLSGKSREDRDAIRFGLAKHKINHLAEIIGGAAATQQNITLKTGNRARFLILHTYSITGGALANGIIDTLSLSFGGVDYLQNVKAVDLQQENIKNRSFAQTGVIVVDMGDDPHGWLPLEGLAEAKLQVTTLATAPASWRVTCAQDYTEGLENFMR